MPKFTSRSDREIRKLLRPNAGQTVFEISGPSLWIDGGTDELVNDMTVLGKASQSRQRLDTVQRMNAEAMGIPVKWPKTSPKQSGKPSGRGS